MLAERAELAGLLNNAYFVREAIGPRDYDDPAFRIALNLVRDLEKLANDQARAELGEDAPTIYRNWFDPPPDSEEPARTRRREFPDPLFATLMLRLVVGRAITWTEFAKFRDAGATIEQIANRVSWNELNPKHAAPNEDFAAKGRKFYGLWHRRILDVLAKGPATRSTIIRGLRENLPEDRKPPPEFAVTHLLHFMWKVGHLSYTEANGCARWSPATEEPTIDQLLQRHLVSAATGFTP